MVETHLPPVVISSTTRQNASDNAYYRVLDFLESRPEGDEYWCPKNLAEKLSTQGPKMAESTVRGILRQLKTTGKVFYVPKGKIHLYAASRRFSNDFNYMFKNFGTKTQTKERYQIHGLNLQLTAASVGLENFKNALPLGGLVWDDRGQKVMDCWDFVGGCVTVQLYRELLEVQVNCSGSPMDLDRFVGWLAQLDGWLLAKRWPRVQGNFAHWVIVQYGFNKDYLKMCFDKPPVAVSLQGFKTWFYRVYDKVLDDGSQVIRSEIHSKEAKDLDSFLSMASGSMSYVQVMNLVQNVAMAMNNSVSRLTDLERAMVRMASNFDSIEKRFQKMDYGHEFDSKSVNFKRGKIK